MIGQTLKELREQAGLTQQDVHVASRALPRVMWISTAKLSRIENGTDDNADPHTIEFLCALYGTDVSDVSPQVAEDLRTYRRALKVVSPVRSRCDSLGARRPNPGEVELPFPADVELPDYALAILAREETTIDVTHDSPRVLVAVG